MLVIQLRHKGVLYQECSVECNLVGERFIVTVFGTASSPSLMACAALGRKRALDEVEEHHSPRCGDALNFSLIPADVLRHIFSHFHPKAVLAVISLVCRRWRAAACRMITKLPSSHLATDRLALVFPSLMSVELTKLINLPPGIVTNLRKVVIKRAELPIPGNPPNPCHCSQVVTTSGLTSLDLEVDWHCDCIKVLCAQNTGLTHLGIFFPPLPCSKEFSERYVSFGRRLHLPLLSSFSLSHSHATILSPWLWFLDRHSCQLTSVAVTVPSPNPNRGEPSGDLELLDALVNTDFPVLRNFELKNFHSQGYNFASRTISHTMEDVAAYNTTVTSLSLSLSGYASFQGYPREVEERKLSHVSLRGIQLHTWPTSWERNMAPMLNTLQSLEILLSSNASLINTRVAKLTSLTALRIGFTEALPTLPRIALPRLRKLVYRTMSFDDTHVICAMQSVAACRELRSLTLASDQFSVWSVEQLCAVAANRGVEKVTLQISGGKPRALSVLEQQFPALRQRVSPWLLLQLQRPPLSVDDKDFMRERSASPDYVFGTINRV